MRQKLESLRGWVKSQAKLLLSPDMRIVKTIVYRELMLSNDGKRDPSMPERVANLVASGGIKINSMDVKMNHLTTQVILLFGVNADVETDGVISGRYINRLSGSYSFMDHNLESVVVDRLPPDSWIDVSDYVRW